MRLNSQYFKQSFLLSIKCSVVLLFAAVFLFPAIAAESRSGTRRQINQAVKTDLPGQDNKCQSYDQKAQLAINISFSKESGKTVTDQYGTCYNVFGYSHFEEKIYPSAYWGVFPLYFFGDNVGVTVSVVNQSTSRKAKLLLRTECYCLNTDGSNGAKLMTPREIETTVNAGESKTIDASFETEYTPEADSGLDRLLIKVYNAPLADGDGEHTVKGEININPNNSTDNQFNLTLADGSAITRDTLSEASTSGFSGYAGTAKCVVVKPKGSGNQNSLILDGKEYVISNADTYSISSDQMTVNLYNDHYQSDGKAMGHWLIGIDAKNASITHTPDGQPNSKGNPDDLIVIKEAIFCPPAFEGDLWQSVSDLLNQ
ncbi:MAG: hypothetical protein A2283_00075 [Lentisphaerae bacterium RIFOXYA12_FULL_48_11]|nr:MAG: hypothetical protein A2283_00075 [Lentisphaerae bacterium RIFOXYA12_FULL_48_11]